MSGAEYVPIDRLSLAHIVAGDPRAARSVLDLLRSIAADFEVEGNGVARHVGEPTRHRPSLALVRDEPMHDEGRVAPALSRVPTEPCKPSQEAVP